MLGRDRAGNRTRVFWSQDTSPHCKARREAPVQLQVLRSLEPPQVGPEHFQATQRTQFNQISVLTAMPGAQGCHSLLQQILTAYQWCEHPRSTGPL
jgi:hypothetical protein